MWKAYTGINWLGGRVNASVYGSDILVGDDANGALYFLDPEGKDDDDAVEGSAVARPFTRQVQTQTTYNSGYKSIPCYGFQAFGSTGKAGSDETINLQVSDNRGSTYDDMGDITVPDTEYSFRLSWKSLGSIQAPGRLFRITDTGALQRIEALQLEVGDDG